MRGWKFVLDYGYSLELYAKGDKRRLIDTNTGRIFLGYLFKEK